MNGNSLLIIGTLPQTSGIGGVTIHTERLLGHLRKRDVSFDFADYRTMPLLKLLRQITKHKVVHLNLSNVYAIFIMLLVAHASRTRSIFTIHCNFGRGNRLQRFILHCCARMATVPVAINNMSYQQCLQFNQRTKFIPAFLPPYKEEKLDDATEQLLSSVNRDKQWVSTNAYNVAFDERRQEVYGIGFLVDFFGKASLQNQYQLFVSDPSGNYRKRFATLPKNITFISHPHNYYELLKRMDIVVRCTTTDGDSLSVKEALYLGKPVLCTDVVDRPEGVTLFKYGDAASLQNALLHPQANSQKPQNTCIEQLTKLYKDLSGENNHPHA